MTKAKEVASRKRETRFLFIFKRPLLTTVPSQIKVQFCLIGTHQFFSQFKALLFCRANRIVHPGDCLDCRTSGPVKRGLANID